ncbi:DUF4998 domain-containing protein [Candidatus Symbiothrix dinenymphae]|uniref:DUF4998 domain-containing protein n=1 Tax=Candidatus Symbiothrix dinenymphae TaxID=467085 RepID=UPI0006C2D9F9|nr:DUF4998 domain-containing protein [Candidatus Symbiothrix dinenymphae]GAP72941.1 hypothetical protein SAMD00024442_5_61 [Candidatus Symbiothrix dinenymphae]
MKKILMNTGTILLTLYVVALAGCADLNDMQQQYLDRGERTYTGKADLLTVNGGHNRLQVTGIMQYAKAAEYCMLRWTNGTDTDSLQVPASNWQATDTMRVVLDGLSEGAYRIFVQTYDKEGNSSLNVECNGNVYGNSFILSAKANMISQINFLMPSVIELSWAVSETAEAVEVVYENKAGSTDTLLLPGDTTTIELSNWKIGGEIKSRTAVIPEAGAIDMMYTNWLVQSFPADDMLDKTKITPLLLANDALPTYGGNAANLFNGRISLNADSEFSSGFGIPMHLTFDLGVKAHLTRFEFWHPTGYNQWSATAVQFWGIADMTGAEITEPRTSNGDGGAAWEAEALAKGWLKLADGPCTSFYTAANEFTSGNPAIIRYLIVRVTEVQGVTGSSKITQLGEVTLYSDNITEL